MYINNLFLKQIAVIEAMKWVVRRRKTAHVQQVNSLATMANVLIISLYATKFQTVRTNPTSHCIAMSMNVPKLRFINADINVLILSLVTSAIAIKDISKLK